MFEKKHESVISGVAFAHRMLRMVCLSLALIALSLGVGIAGYQMTEDMRALDALLNASMILGGMGPVDTMHTDGGKLFASFYALYSGLVMIAVMGVCMGPVVHRILHKFHAEPDQD